MPDIRDRVEQDRGLLKKIQLVIPGYAGYRRREDIRAADNLLRIQLANQLKGVRGELEDIRDGLAMEGKIQGLQGIGNIIFTVEGLEAKVRHAEGGYSGISATIQIKETELDKLYEYDYAMLDSLDKAAAVVPMIRDAGDPKSYDASLKACREAIAGFETAWKNRTMAVTGIQVRGRHDPDFVLLRRCTADGSDGGPEGRHRRRHDGRLGRPVQATEHHVEGPAEHPDERQHRRPGGRDRGVLPRREGAGVFGPPGPVRADVPERRDPGQAHPGPLRRRPAGGGLLPPEAHLRREVRDPGGVPVPGPGLRHGAAPRLRGLPVSAQGPGDVHQPVRRDVRRGDLRGGRGPHQERTDETTQRHARQDEGERPEGRRLRGEPQRHRTGRARELEASLRDPRAGDPQDH